MTIAYNPKLPKGLKFYFDVNNPKCIANPGSTTIASGSGSTKLNCLVSSLQLQAYDNTNTNMTFVEDNGSYCYNQVGTNGGDPGWTSTTNLTRVDSYTFIGWYKYQYGSSYQRAENIYGGGFGSRTSFYLTPSGTSSSHGYLRHSDAGGDNGYSRTANYSANDGEWHMFATTDTGGDGNQTTKLYIDGDLKHTNSSNASYDTPDGEGQVVWGSWSGTYGNFGGKTNCFMYFERVLSDAEIKDVYNSLKGRFA
jgi:hypothetical protein